MAKKCPKCPPMGAPDWMVTYGDLMTLLLCFFVLLFSFSSMETKKFESLKESMRGAFGVLKGDSTTLGKGKAKKPPKATDKSFDKAVAKVLRKIKRQKIPKEKVEMMAAAVLSATQALRMVSDQREEVEKIVRELEEPSSVIEDTSKNYSKVDRKLDVTKPVRNFPTERKQFSGALEKSNQESESAVNKLDPPRSKGENQDPFRSEASRIDISQGRDQNSMENTGRQKKKDKLSGRNKPKAKNMDKERYSSENKDYDYRQKPIIQKTMDQFTTLSGMVQMTSQDLSHAVFHFEEDLLFNKDSVELREQAKEIVYKVFLDNYNRDKGSIFQLESHTDFSLQPSEKYPTTWHLASARANAILEFLLEENEEFDPNRFSVVSFGAYQPKYQYQNNQRDLKQNRRLEVRMFQKP